MSDKIRQAAEAVTNGLLGDDPSLADTTNKVEKILRDTLKPTRVWACGPRDKANLVMFLNRSHIHAMQRGSAMDDRLCIRTFDVIEVPE